MRRIFGVGTAAFLLLVPVLVARQEGMKAHAELKNAKGESIGHATLMETPHGVLISADLKGLPAGAHAFHIHTVGRCEPPFESAGGHFNPTKAEHGFANPRGMHAGDMPNLHPGQGGAGQFEVLVQNVTLSAGQNSLFDADGSALVIHQGADDYRSDPAGNAGDRIACGVISK